MSDHYDVVVVGGGVIGTAVFHRLCTETRLRTILVEQSRFALGSTGWSGAVIRCFDLDRVLTDLACEGVRYYRQLPHEVAIETRRPTQFLHFIYPDQEKYARDEVARLASDVELAWLPRKQAEARFPQVSWEGLAGAVFEPFAAWMEPARMCQHWVDTARDAGGTAVEGVRFEGVISRAGDFEGIATNMGPIYARRAVLCTGAWTEAAARNAGVALPRPVRAKKIQLNSYLTAGCVRSYPAYLDPGLHIYGRPDTDRLLVGSPVPEWSDQPDVTEIPTLEHAQNTLALAARRFRELASAQPAGGYRRFDGYTDDARGIVAELDDGIVVATGFSGGGFKLAPAVARAVKHLIADQANKE